MGRIHTDAVTRSVSKRQPEQRMPLGLLLGRESLWYKLLWIRIELRVVMDAFYRHHDHAVGRHAHATNHAILKEIFVVDNFN